MGVLTALCFCIAGLNGCSHMQTPGNLGNVRVGDGSTGDTINISPDQVRQTNPGAPVNAFGEHYDGDQEQRIAEKTLAAWRTALAHDKKDRATSDADWKKQRGADEQSAMTQLQALSKQYPGSSTIIFMMGQVEDHFGNSAKAAELYASASKKNTFNSMYVFKMAEAERKSGDCKQAIEHYRTLLKQDPDFYATRLGLARCLLKQDPKSSEAAQLLEQVLAKEPSNEDARQLLNEIKGDKTRKTSQ